MEDSCGDFTLEVLIIASSPENSLVGSVLADYDARKICVIIHVLGHEHAELSGFSHVWQHIVRCHTPHSQIGEELDSFYVGQGIAEVVERELQAMIVSLPKIRRDWAS